MTTKRNHLLGATESVNLVWQHGSGSEHVHLCVPLNSSRTFTPRHRSASHLGWRNGHVAWMAWWKFPRDSGNRTMEEPSSPGFWSPTCPIVSSSAGLIQSWADTQASPHWAGREKQEGPSDTVVIVRDHHWDKG